MARLRALGSFLLSLGPFQADAFLRPRAASLRNPRALRAIDDAEVATFGEEEEVDVIIIGSGIGGLSAAALLARYGKRVLVLEAHEHPGGCAHGFDIRASKAKGGGTYKFDAGPSLWAGMSKPSTNPLRQVMDATGASGSVEWVGYTGWGLHYAREGYGFRFTVGPTAFERAVERHAGGPGGVREWRQLLARVEPIVTAAMGTPPMALRGDLWAGVTAAPATLGSVVQASFEAKAWVPQYLTGPFSSLMDELPNPWLRDWLDYLSFALSGLDATGTIAAAVVYTLGDLHRPGAYLDYPLGGSEAVIQALVKAIEAPLPPPNGGGPGGGGPVGGQVRLRSRVAEILVESEPGLAAGFLGGGARAVGVRLGSAAGEPGAGGPGGLGGGAVVRCREGVISNAPIWDTLKLLPEGGASRNNPKVAAWAAARAATPATGSFVHLHLGIDAAGLPEDLDCHHSVLLDWGLGITGRENMYIVSIPSLFDAQLAPEGKHVVHVYAAASEPYGAWEGMDRKSKAYADAKKRAAEPLWAALETIVPDIRSRVEVDLCGTPLTHERFTRRHQGTYGPSGGKVEGDLDFLGSSTPISGLKLCGDSCFPGIGVPAAAASGVIAAHTFVPLGQHLALLDELKQGGKLHAGRGWWAAPGDPPIAPGGRISMRCEEGSPEAYSL